MNKWSFVGIPFVVDKATAFNKVCEVFELTPVQLRSRRRFRRNVDAKSALCYILHRKIKLPSTEVAAYLSINHATVLHHCKKAESLIEIDEDFKNKFKQLRITYN